MAATCCRCDERASMQPRLLVWLNMAGLLHSSLWPLQLGCFDMAVLGVCVSPSLLCRLW